MIKSPREINEANRKFWGNKQNWLDPLKNYMKENPDFEEVIDRASEKLIAEEFNEAVQKNFGRSTKYKMINGIKFTNLVDVSSKKIKKEEPTFEKPKRKFNFDE